MSPAGHRRARPRASRAYLGVSGPLRRSTSHHSAAFALPIILTALSARNVRNVTAKLMESGNGNAKLMGSGVRPTAGPARLGPARLVPRRGERTVTPESPSVQQIVACGTEWRSSQTLLPGRETRSWEPVFPACYRPGVPAGTAGARGCACGERLFYGIVITRQHLAREITAAQSSSPAPCPRAKSASRCPPRRPAARTEASEVTMIAPA